MRAPAAVLIAVAGLAVTAGAPVAAQPLLRVPDDVADLQQAIRRVADHGVIELAPGGHRAPVGGFRIANLGKAFTIRSAAGGRAVLDGGGATPILDLRNRDRASGGRVTFERLTFRDGFSAAESFSGAVTLHAADARFVDCVFEDNRVDAPTTGGGAVGIAAGSSAAIEGGTFRRNHARTRGGAIEVRGAELAIDGTLFTANRVNLPGHKATASGGAILVIDGEVAVTDAIFEGNRAAWVGGAIYAFGHYSGAGAGSALHVARSTFRGNLAHPDPCCPAPGPTGGGAIHAEDRTAVTIRGSLFSGNEGRFGGALQSFRAELDVAGSIFRDNRAAQAGEPLGLGGAVAALSAAGVEAGPNRPPAAAAVRDSLFEGDPGGVPASGFGGCLQVSGDLPHLAAGRGGPAENRAPVALDRVAFSRCRVETPSQVEAVGGAVDLSLADLAGRRVLFLDSATPSDGGAGGGLSVREESAVTLREATFAGNAAGRRGGAVLVSGASRFETTHSRFLDNRVGSGATGAPAQSLGAALYSIAPGAVPPGREGDLTGVVADSLFAGNAGVEIRDVEPAGGERNRLRYDANAFFSTSFGATVYSHNRAAPGGLDVAGLNTLVVSGSPPIDKSGRPNTRLGARPHAGDLLVFPPAGAPGGRSEAAVAFAWSGSRAVLEVPGGADRSLPEHRGVVELPGARPGRYTLRVDGVAVASDLLPAASPALPPGPFLASQAVPGFRFKVQILGGDAPIPGVQEPSCIPETVCVSGAVSGRAEVFLRVVGPKPNGYLQPTLAKFSTSRVRVWIEQSASGQVRFYELGPVGPPGTGADTLAILDGRLDRTGFLPAGVRSAVLVASRASDADLEPSAPAAGPVPPVPAGGWLATPELPGFRFTVRIGGGGESRLGRKEPACILETLCVSGAVPGRGEVFLRVVGPKPNGFLQPTLVTFSTSTIEVWIEQRSTGALRYYRLEGAAPGSGAALDGLIDREGFRP